MLFVRSWVGQRALSSGLIEATWILCLNVSVGVVVLRYTGKREEGEEGQVPEGFLDFRFQTLPHRIEMREQRLGFHY